MYQKKDWMPFLRNLIYWILGRLLLLAKRQVL
jgi:hypothetical protein